MFRNALLLSLFVAFLAPVFSHAQEGVSTGLGALVAELELNNPELKAARRDVDMRVARIAPAGALPDPTLSVGYMGGWRRPPFFPSSATRDAGRQFGLTQELIYPGKLALRTRIAATEADVVRWNTEDTRVRLIADLKNAYVQYVYADRAIAIVRRNKELMDQFRRIAEARFAVGKAVQQDVIKAQLEISMLIEREAMLERDRQALRSQINALLYRAPDTQLDARLAVAVTPLPADVAALRARVVERAPAIKREERRIDRGQQALALARKEVLPDFEVRFTSDQPVGGMPWLYGFDVMVKLPVFWQRKQRPMIAEAAASLESSRRMRESTLAMAIADVTEQHAMGFTSQRLITLYSDSLLPQARLALESALASYEVGRVDFLTLLMNFAAVLTYELGLEAQTAAYRQALARLEPLVGLEFIR